MVKKTNKKKKKGYKIESQLSFFALFAQCGVQREREMVEKEREKKEQEHQLHPRLCVGVRSFFARLG